jgi:outer membrane receptor protein involved in Fe transport
MHHPTQGVARHCALLFAIVFLFTDLVVGQTSRGTVTGLVSDAQQSAVPNANVELTSLSTNTTRSTTTNEAGLYRFDAVEPGRYTLQVKSTGFRSFAAKEFVVGAAQVLTLDAAMEIGDVQQVVEISAQSVQLQTEAPVRAANITTKQIDELPLASRNPYMLALTAPGVTTNKFTTPTGTFSVNGGRGRSNNFMIDGTDNNDISVAGQALRIANPGLIQEVNVQTSNYDAEFGRAGGAVVNIITRSGSNDFHGQAGFILDSTWDDAISSSLSNSPEVQARGRNLPGTEQQYDGSLGGRIIRDKLFFHLSYLELRQGSTSAVTMATFSAAGRARFRELFPLGRNANADKLLQVTDGYDATFQLAPIDLGDGRGSIEFGRGVFSYPQTARQRQYGSRLDYHINERDMLSGRFIIDDLDQPVGGERQSFPSFFTSGLTKTKVVGLTETHVFSPTFTNELRLNYMRYLLDSPLDPENPLGRTSSLIAIAGINTSAQFPYGVGTNYPQGRLFNNYTIQDTMSVVKGTHTLRFGVDLMNQRARQAAPFNDRGILNYQISTGYTGLANFVDDFGGANGNTQRAFGNPFYYPSLYRQAYFIQDRWRASQSLTLSLGLRYEYFGTPMNVVPAPAFTGLFNIDPVTLTGPFGQPNKIQADKNNFSPMMGIAYSPRFDQGFLGWLFGDRRTSFRTGYGIGYDSYFNNITSNVAASAPYNLSVTHTSLVDVANPRGTPTLSSQLPQTPPLPSPRLSQSGIAANLVNPYYQRWSFTIQRELPSNWLLDVGYVGSKGTKLFATEQLNPTVPVSLRAPVPAFVPASAREPRLDPLQGSRSIRTNGGSSSYNSFQAEVKRRFANGFQFNSSYTWSKAIDNISELFSFGNTASLGGFVAPTYYGGATLDRAVSSFDRPHRWVFNYTYELPWLREQKNVLGYVLGGWQLSGITVYESGNPYTIVNGSDSDGLEGSDRPNFNPLGAPGVRAVPDNTSATGYVNPDAVDAAGNSVRAPIDPREARFIGLPVNPDGNVVGPMGNLGRNTERAPAIKNWDVNVVKRFRLREGMFLQLRSEFYNIFNTPQYGTVSVSPFAPAQNTQTIAANVNGSAGGVFAKATAVDGGGRVIRWQARIEF